MVASRPSGPEGLPVLGNTLQFVRGQEAFYEDAATYGVFRASRNGIPATTSSRSTSSDSASTTR